jgi:hypothetical protein
LRSNPRSVCRVNTHRRPGNGICVGGDSGSLHDYRKVPFTIIERFPSRLSKGSLHDYRKVPFTIIETNIQFQDESDTGDFTATGPLCSAGTFLDTLSGSRRFGRAAIQHPLENVTGDTVYSCADGSGTIFMLKHARLVATPPGIDNTGPGSLHGGTGAYTNLTGHGFDTGANGVGQISGTIVQG